MPLPITLALRIPLSPVWSRGRAAGITATFCLLVGVLLGSTGIAMAFALSLGAALASRAPRWSSS